VVVNLSCVGDLVPYSRAGRAFAVVGSIFGVLFFALPMSVVASHFDREYLIYERKQKLRKELLLSIDDEVSKVLNQVNGPDEENGNIDRNSNVDAAPSSGTAGENSVPQLSPRQSIVQHMQEEKKVRTIKASIVSTMVRNLTAHKSSQLLDDNMKGAVDSSGFGLEMMENPMKTPPPNGNIKNSGDFTMTNNEVTGVKTDVVALMGNRRCLLIESIVDGTIQLSELTSRADLQDVITALRNEYAVLSDRYRSFESATRIHR
jgi:hypothetical protein